MPKVRTEDLPMNQEKSDPESPDSLSEESLLSNGWIRVGDKSILKILSCTICSNIFRDPTRINLCLHAFCKECIEEMFQKSKIKCCPICKIDLGTSPEQFLRADERVKNLIATLFPFGNSEGPNGMKASPPENETTKKSHDDRYLAGERAQLYQNPSKVSDKKDKFPQVSGGTAFESKDVKHFLEGETKLEVQTKKRRNTKRRARQFMPSERKDKEKIEPSNGFIDSGKANGKALSGVAVSYEHSSISQSVWMYLVPGQDETGHAYPKLQKSYLHLKNGKNMPVSYIHKYVASKLNLNESEVEIACFGKRLMQSLTLSRVNDIWIDAISKSPSKRFVSQKEIEKMDGKDFVMELQYRRAKKSNARNQN